MSDLPMASALRSPTRLPWAEFSTSPADGGSAAPPALRAVASAFPRAVAWRGPLVSLVLHAAFVFFLALCTYRATGGPASILLRAAMPGDPIAPPTLVMAATASSAAPAHLTAAGTFETTVPAMTGEVLERQAALVTRSIEPPVGTQSADGVGDPELFDEQSIAMESGGASETVAAQGLSDASGTRFFGVKATGERFVFIIDSSTSMEGIRWRAAVRELVRCISSLTTDQQYYVICFDYRTHLMFNHRPDTIEYNHTDPNSLKRFKRWLGSVQMGRATRPMEAVAVALNLRPDAIFLLSDGEFQDDTRGFLLTGNGLQEDALRIPVHTIGLMSDIGFAALRTIAEENGGTFQQVAP
jgi:hypothetical protein